VSQYDVGLPPLPAAPNDVAAMRQVLENPKLGGFDRVDTLISPNPTQMQDAINKLFAECQKDDLVLLFFSGHGITDDNGRLFLTTRLTNETRFKATSVSASFVHDVMHDSSCQRQVVILDCCYSGAFAEGWQPRSIDLDIKQQLALGSKGRAVLTSSSAVQKSFEDKDSGIYTRYLVEGIKTGAADRNRNGTISIQELHEYAKEKVQATKPAMKPEFYPHKEGFNIVLTRSPINDPELEYRREVEKWIERNPGEISMIGRRNLDGLARRLEILPEVAARIETAVLAPYEEYKQNLKEYKEAYIEALGKGYPPSEVTSEELQDFQNFLGLRDEDVLPIEEEAAQSGQIVQLSAPPGVRANEKTGIQLLRQFFNSFLVNSSSTSVRYLSGIALAVILVFTGGIWILKSSGNFDLLALINDRQSNSTTPSKFMQERMSFGEKILLDEEGEKVNFEFRDTKKKGIKAFAKGDYEAAIENLDLARKKNKNSPETLIYLNNARAAKNPKAHLIAVPVPIGSSPNSALEMLRGFAQAQDEVNQTGGVNGIPIKFAIINDDDKPETAKKIASELVKMTEVLGVIGHYSSGTTLEVASIYKEGKLVLITPISTASTLSRYSDYVFRTNINTITGAKALSDYMLNVWKLKKVAIFHAQGTYSQFLTENFNKDVSNQNIGQVVYDVDMSQPSFNPEQEFQKAREKGAEVLLLVPALDDTREKALQVINANHQQLKMLGDIANLYGVETLRNGQDSVGMVMAISWSVDGEQKSDFAEQAKHLWGGNVNWSTAMSYDAAQAMIAAMKRNSTNTPTRDTVQQALSDLSLSAPGTSGTFHFSGGDRIPQPLQLVKIRPANPSHSGTGYDFVPIK
jgi:branched-chain amino acid transport system substrate-binding protein